MSTQSRGQAERRTVTLYSVHCEIIDELAEEGGFYGNASAALRRIIDEWVVLKAARLPLLSTDSAVEYKTE